MITREVLGNYGMVGFFAAVRRMSCFVCFAALLPLVATGCSGRSTRSSDGSHTGGGRGGSSSGGSSAGRSALPDACNDRALADVQNGHDVLPGYAAERDPRVADWVAALGTDQLFTEMQGTPMPPTQLNFLDMQRSLDLPLADGSVLRGYLYRSGSRGVNLDDGQPSRPSDGRDYSTAFPAESARGASFDLELEWELGEAIGDEAMASKNTLLRGPGVDLVRHPYWGGAQDAYGEDAYHAGRMGSAFAAGVQAHVPACAEHFVAYGIERFREFLNVSVDEQTLREIYGRPFEQVVRDGGVACVLGAMNLVNGEEAVASSHLIHDILKGPVSEGGFGFRGFVITDQFAAQGDQASLDDATNATVAAKMANAGLDVELPVKLRYDSLGTVVADGRVPASIIADAASRILEQKARFGSALTTDPYGRGTSTSTLVGASLAPNAAHVALAERAALESAVLLQNGPPSAPTLPIPSGVGTIAVIGAEVNVQLISTTPPKSCTRANDANMGCSFHFATDVALGDRGSSRVNADPAASIGPFDGIRAGAALHGNPTVIQGNTAAAAAGADFIVVVVGLTPADEGEEFTIPAGGDRKTLDLPADQASLVADVLALDKPTAIVIESGSVVNLPWLTAPNQNQATIWAGYGGMRAGVALGLLLFGDANFGGKMPLAWPKESALPAFIGAANGDTTLGYFFGYRDFDRRQKLGEAVDLVFPYGHGLSYTTFAYSNASVACAKVTPDAVLDVTVDVANTGAVDGDEVVFLFVEGPAVAKAAAETSASDHRAVRELKSFVRVHVAQGASAHVALPLRIQDLRHWSGGASGGWVLDPGEYRVLVGPRDAEDALVFAGAFTIGG